MPGTNRYMERDERGDTLIELLFAVVIMSIAVASLMGALITSISSAGEHRALAGDDAVLKSFAEAYKQQIEDAQTVAFVPCDSAAYAVSYTAPSGYTVSQKSIAYWNGSDFVTSPCSMTTANEGVQLITIVAQGPSKFTQALSFVIRKPT